MSDNMWQWLPLELQFRSGEVVTASEAVRFNNWLKGLLVDGIDRPSIYIPNPGNVGDSLIVLGTIQLFHHLNIRYQVGSPYGKYEGELLAYGKVTQSAPTSLGTITSPGIIIQSFCFLTLFADMNHC